MEVSKTGLPDLGVKILPTGAPNICIYIYTYTYTFRIVPHEKAGVGIRQIRPCCCWRVCLRGGCHLSLGYGLSPTTGQRCERICPNHGRTLRRLSSVIGTWKYCPPTVRKRLRIIFAATCRDPGTWLSRLRFCRS